MELKNTVALVKTRNEKLHQYFIDPACTKGEVFDTLSEWRQEIFKSMQDDMAAEKTKEPTDINPIAPEAPKEPTA